MKCVITGATSGIGKEFARILSNKGYELILIGRNKNKLREIKKLGKTLCIDLSKEKDVIKLTKKLKKEKIDMVINNAGIGVYGLFKDSKLEEELEMINTNIIALHILTKFFYQKFLEQNSGILLNVSSTAAYTVGPFMSSYYATKSYVYKLTKAIIEENEKLKNNVRISILLPGPTYTNFNNKLGINFSSKAMTSTEVVEYTLRQLQKNRQIIVPGLKNRVLKVLVSLLPEILTTKINYKIQSSKVIK